MSDFTLDDILKTIGPPWRAGMSSLPDVWGRSVVGRLPAVEALRELSSRRSLVVIVTLDDCGDAGLWLHSSSSVRTHRRVRVPTWAEIKLTHAGIHKDRAVVQLLPPSSHWISVSECLHLWERLDAPTVPETVWRHG